LAVRLLTYYFYKFPSLNSASSYEQPLKKFRNVYQVQKRHRLAENPCSVPMGLFCTAASRLDGTELKFGHPEQRAFWQRVGAIQSLISLAIVTEIRARRAINDVWPERGDEIDLNLIGLLDARGFEREILNRPNNMNLKKLVSKWKTDRIENQRAWRRRLVPPLPTPPSPPPPQVTPLPPPQPPSSPPLQYDFVTLCGCN
jgi:hypothetical protein